MQQGKESLSYIAKMAQKAKREDLAKSVSTFLALAYWNMYKEHEMVTKINIDCFTPL